MSDQLLDLHKNITKAHAMLYEVMETSLNQAWDSQNEQQRASEGWVGFLKDVNEQMANIQGGVSEAAEWAANEVRGVVSQVLKDISEERRANFDSVERLGEVRVPTRSCELLLTAPGYSAEPRLCSEVGSEDGGNLVKC